MNRRVLAGPLLLSACLLFGCGDNADGSGGGGASSQSTNVTNTSGNASTTGQTTSTNGTSSSQSTTGSANTGAGGGCEGAVTFDGVDDVLLTTVGAEVGKADQFSLAVRVRPDPLPNGGTAFVAGRHQDGDSNGYYMALKNENGQHRAQFIVFTGSGTCSATANLTLPSAGHVHLLGSFASPNVRVFIDGALASDEACGNFTCNITPSSVFSTGRSSGGVFPYAGLMDEVAYYGQAFSAGFDPNSLGCGSDARLRYTFDTVMGGRDSTVPEVCGQSADATVGLAAGPDAADPLFGCQ